MTAKQRTQQQAIINAAKYLRRKKNDVKEGYKLLGKHAANGFVNFMWKNVLIEPRVDKGRYANNDTE